MAGQQVFIAVINLNSNIPTFVVGEEVIQASTPGLVTMAEEIASSQDLSDKIAAFAFVGISSTSTTPPSTSPTSSAKVVGTSKVLLIVLLFLPLALVI